MFMNSYEENNDSEMVVDGGFALYSAHFLNSFISLLCPTKYKKILNITTLQIEELRQEEVTVPNSYVMHSNDG